MQCLTYTLYDIQRNSPSTIDDGNDPSIVEGTGPGNTFLRNAPS